MKLNLEIYDFHELNIDQQDKIVEDIQKILNENVILHKAILKLTEMDKYL